MTDEANPDATCDEDELNLLAVDPGIRCTGVAWLRGNKRTVYSLRPAMKKSPTGKNISRAPRLIAREIVSELPDLCWDVVSIEVPRVYPYERRKDPNSLIQLALLIGNLEALISAHTVWEIPPSMWKGQIPKDKHHPQIRARANYWARTSKDALDALGLLLYTQDMLAANAAARRKRGL